MAHFPPVYGDRESEILIAVYENPDLSFDAYLLTQRLTRLTAAAPEFEPALRKTVKAIEQLIVKGLIDGTQLKSGNVLYFSDLKLRYKGKQAAIQERDRVEELKRELPKVLKEANDGVEEMRKSQKK